MRYIKGYYAVYNGEGKLSLQGDGALWYLNSDGYFANRFGTVVNPTPNYFNTIVDGIYFSTAAVKSHPPRIDFMLPETHFLFDFPVFARSMFYDMSEEKREIQDNFATRVIYDIIKTKLNTTI